MASAKNKYSSVIKKIESDAGHTFMPIIGPIKGQVLVDTVKKKKPKKILEIGTFVGYSAILMAHALNSKKYPHIVTIEKDPDTASKAASNIKEGGLSEKIDLLQGDAKEVIPNLEGSFDLLFLDAAKEDYLYYLFLSEDKLSKNAVIIADNVKIFKEAMSDYLEYVRDSGKFESKTYDFQTDAVEVSQMI